MADQGKRLGRALRGCAEAGVPAVDLWPAVRGELGEMTPTKRDGRPSRTRFVPRTRGGWTLVGLVTLFAIGAGAYATGGIMDALDYVFGSTVPYVQEHELGVPVGEEVSRDGATVTIDRVYADQHYVVVGFHVDGLDELGDAPGDAHDDLFADARLSGPGAEGDDAGERFPMTDGFWASWAPPAEAAPGVPGPPKGSQVGTVVFQAPHELAQGENRFRFEVGLVRGGAQESVVRPFVFDLKARVEPAPTIEVDQTVEKNGVPITLTRVVNSPARTYAFLCFDPPEGKYDLPAVETGPFGLGGGHLAELPVNHPGDAEGAAAEGCATYNFGKTLVDEPGTHRLTITKLVSSDPSEGGSLEGPWRFGFEVPDP